jgi:hypothetical protein
MIKFGLLPLNPPRSLPSHESLRLIYEDKVNVPQDGVFQTRSSDGEVKRRFVIHASGQSIDQAGSECVPAADTINDEGLAKIKTW